MKKSACWTLCLLLAGSTAAWGQTTSARNAIQNRQQAALMAEAFYEVLLGELNARQSNPGAAFSLLLDAATKINDVRLYQRAVDLALQSRSGDAALQAARAWKGANPSSRQANLYILQILLALNRLGDATEPLRAEVDLTPAEERNATLANLHRHLGQVTDKKRAASVLEQAIAPYLQAPATASAAWTSVGRVRLSANDTTGALDAAQKAYQAEPSAIGPGLLALELLEKNVPGALNLLNQSLAKVAQPELRLSLIQWQLESKMYSAALDQLKDMTQAQPKVPQAWLMLGLLHVDENRPQAAEVALKRYLGLVQDQANPSQRGLAQAHLGLAQVAEKQLDDQAAQEWLQKVDHPDFVLQAHSRRAQLLARQGKLGEARSLIQNLPVGNANQARGKLLAEVKLLRDNKQYLAAHGLLNMAVLRDPQDNDMLYELAMLDEKLNRLDDMERRLRELIRRLPDQPHAYNALGYSLADRNLRLAEAKQLITRALELAPEDPAITDSLGWVEFRLGNLPLALSLLKKAYASQSDAEIAAHMGEVLWQLNQREEAQKIWREGLQKGGDTETLRETLRRLKVDL
jgi:tetratricopeptide (TPR) repeat protein